MTKTNNVNTIVEMAVETLSVAEMKKLVKVLESKIEAKSNDAAIKAAEAKVAKMAEEAIKAREALKALKANKNTKIAKISASQQGRKWANNGVEEKRVYELPEGYVFGRLKKSSAVTEEQNLGKIFKLRNVKKVVPAVESVKEAA